MFESAIFLLLAADRASRGIILDLSQQYFPHHETASCHKTCINNDLKRCNTSSHLSWHSGCVAVSALQSGELEHRMATSPMNGGVGRIVLVLLSVPPSPSNPLSLGSQIMLSWALTFLIIALVAAVLGFGGLAGTASWAAQVCFVVFLILFVISAVTGRSTPRV